jgi:pSer/pThr/pTyr-binding forkhead associated (FHA) protein
MPLEKITYIMGRVDPVSNVFPEIDLSNDGALAKSVSRRHARILKQSDNLFIEDLGSINGTFVNGKKLDPYLPEILSDGDRLQLGKLPIEVKIRRQ